MACKHRQPRHRMGKTFTQSHTEKLKFKHGPLCSCPADSLWNHILREIVTPREKSHHGPGFFLFGVKYMTSCPQRACFCGGDQTWSPHMQGKCPLLLCCILDLWWTRTRCSPASMLSLSICVSPCFPQGQLAPATR